MFGTTLPANKFQFAKASGCILIKIPERSFLKDSHFTLERADYLCGNILQKTAIPASFYMIAQ